MVRKDDDRVLPATRMVAAVVIPFLVLAWLILYLNPDLSARRFAWDIQPNLTAVYMGAGYLGGAYLFIRALFGRRWHPVAAGFPAISAFTLAMLVATMLHWDRFRLDHFPFQLWLGLYVLTPIIVPLIWLRNRRTDSGNPDPIDVIVPWRVRLPVRILGVFLLVIVMAGFVAPQVLITVWPWKLTALTARVVAGWGALLGFANMYISWDKRWSSWKVGVESIALWHSLFLVRAASFRHDFADGNLVNWYTLSAVGILIVMVGLYTVMESRRRSGAFSSLSAA